MDREWPRILFGNLLGNALAVVRVTALWVVLMVGFTVFLVLFPIMLLAGRERRIFMKLGTFIDDLCHSLSPV